MKYSQDGVGHQWHRDEPPKRRQHISLSGRRVFDIATIRVSEISFRIPTLCKHQTIYDTFRESMKISDISPTNHMTSR